MNKYVYLAGPITDTTVEEANEWRKRIRHSLSTRGIIGISPLRCEPQEGNVYALTYEDIKFGTRDAIATKNCFDVDNCDMVLTYLPTLSPGTLLEMGYAFSQSKPNVVVTTLPGLVNHPLVQHMSGWIVPDFDHAIDIIEGMLGDY